MDSEENSHRVYPRSFQGSGPGFTGDISRGESYGSVGRTPLTARGHVTPFKEQQQGRPSQTCGSCGKDFLIKNTYKRHLKSCQFKVKLKKKQKLDFQGHSGRKNMKKRDLLEECPSSSSDQGDNDYIYDKNENGKDNGKLM